MADTLQEKLLTDKRPQVLDDCVRLIDDEVSSKGGISGLAIKAGYKVVCAIKPGVIKEVMDSLLDDFVKRLEPFYAEHKAAAKGTFADHILGKKGSVADALLGITDDRARISKNATMKSAYEKLRPFGKKNVEEALPRVARTLGRHL